MTTIQKNKNMLTTLNTDVGNNDTSISNDAFDKKISQNKNNNMLHAEIFLVTQLLEDNKNDTFDVEKFLSLLSLIFKRTLKNDDLLQDFEVNILRPNSYRLFSFEDLLEIINKVSNNETSKAKWEIFCQITTIIIDFLANKNNEMQTDININDAVLRTQKSNERNDDQYVRKYNDKNIKNNKITIIDNNQINYTDSNITNSNKQNDNKHIERNNDKKAKNSKAIITDGERNDNINNDIATIIDNIAQMILLNKNLTSQEPLQQSIEDVKNKAIILSPTSGILMLNNNPYLFFIKKILGISPIDDWCDRLNTKIYGTLIHNIMQKFAYKCIELSLNDINNYNFIQKIYTQTVNDVVKDFGIQLNEFLEEKIKLISETAIMLEANAKRQNIQVLIEKKFSHQINGITIEARADRAEIDNKNKYIYIYDYKTGNLPENSQEVNGEKTQLLIIAVLISKMEQYKNYKVKKLQYIDLSGKHHYHHQSNGEIDVNKIKHTEVNLCKLIDKFFSKNNTVCLNDIIYLDTNSILDGRDQILHFARKNILY